MGLISGLIMRIGTTNIYSGIFVYFHHNYSNCYCYHHHFYIYLHVITLILITVTIFWLISMAGYPFFLSAFGKSQDFPLTTGEGQGRLYLGSAAMENEHYSQQYALAAHLGARIWQPGLLGAKRWFLGNRRIPSGNLT